MLVGNVHLITGGGDTVMPLLALLKKEGWETEGNPDIDIRTYSQFLVDDARSLCERSSTRAVTDRRRVFIVVTPNLTYEAQNTRLKTLEEPTGNALFFFIVPAPEALLPTVRSRAQMLILGDKEARSTIDAGAFLAATPQRRLEMLKPLLERDGDDQPAGGRDLSGIIMFLSSLERMLAERATDVRAGLDIASREGLESVYRARKYATDKGSMLKSLLEQVALLTPVISS